jgi:hypothetical protein
MALTEDQRERISRNRERALQKQKERKERLEKEKKENEQTEKRELEKKTIPSSSPSSNKKQKVDLELELEDFEVGASEWITKTEAMKMYCVPQGTLAVCEVEERPNPHNKGWKPMKLYRRSEIRERSRKRWEGLEGLCAEREERQQKQLKRDIETARSIFE